MKSFCKQILKKFGISVRVFLDDIKTNCSKIGKGYKSIFWSQYL